ncbi:MAG: hypothetical protein AAF515_03415 [Pseudomonadota bacterium]
MNRLSKLIIVALLCSPGAGASAEEICTAEGGYVVGYFNGVGNTAAMALAGMAGIKKSMLNRSIFTTAEDGSTRTFLDENNRSEPVAFEAFFNTTGSENGRSVFEDLVEVFEQRRLELGETTSSRWDLFWATLSGRSSATLWDILAASDTAAFNEWESALADELTNRIVASLGHLVESPPTDRDAATQQTRLKSLAVEGKKLLLIAHSQGNLFVNPAYDAVLEVDGFSAQNAAVVHIAPASPTVRGEYSLASRDIIINALRLTGQYTVQDNNVDIPLSHLQEDVTGHFLVETYLNLLLETGPQVSSMFERAFNSLVTPTTDASEGFFTVTLTWDGSGDVDLHAFEPDGRHVYYASRQGNAGRLDVDNVVARGPEHYFASCDSQALSTGTYRFGINHFAAANDRRATLQVASLADGVLFTTNPPVDVGPAQGAAGNSSPRLIVDVNVSIDDNGEYRAVARTN